MSSFTGSIGDDESPLTGSNRPFDDDDGYTGYDPRLSSQRFDSFNYSVKNLGGDSSPIFPSQSYSAGDEALCRQSVSEAPPSILPLPTEMQAEEGFALREWRRQNAIRLQEKEKKEKEMVRQIIGEAENYKEEFYRKRQLAIQNKATSNREKEKLFLGNREKFHAEAEKNYWKAIAELIPHEVPTLEKRGKKDQDKKKTSVVVIQGPKPGKPTDLSRMRSIHVKLKHNPPPHMKPKPPATAEAAPGASSAKAEAASASEITAAASSE